MKKFVIGDIHGNYRALKQVFERSHFDYGKDMLICLGDIADGYPETPQCIEELKKLKKLVLVWGNHCLWLDRWLNYGAAPIIWTQQGGQATIDAYLKEAEETDGTPLMVQHRDFFKQARKYYIDKRGRCFIHGGMPVYRDRIQDCSLEELVWDRNTADAVLRGLDITETRFTELYLGHTTTEQQTYQPIIKNNIILMDTGGGWGGKLSMMDIDSKEVFQSDRVNILYPNNHGRANNGTV